jgi:hypothetical protein
VSWLFSRTKRGSPIPFLDILPNFGRLQLVLGKRGGEDCPSKTSHFGSFRFVLLKQVISVHFGLFCNVWLVLVILQEHFGSFWSVLQSLACFCDPTTRCLLPGLSLIYLVLNLRKPAISDKSHKPGQKLIQECHTCKLHTL